MAPHTPRVVLLGPTGSGKSKQASLLASKYGLVDGESLDAELMKTTGDFLCTQCLALI